MAKKLNDPKSVPSDNSAPLCAESKKKPCKGFVLCLYAALLIISVAVSIVLAEHQYSPVCAFKKSLYAKANLDVTEYADVSYYVNFCSFRTKEEYISENNRLIETDPAYYNSWKDANRSITYSDVTVIKLSPEEVAAEKNRLDDTGCFHDIDKIKDIRAMCYVEYSNGEALEKTCYAIRVGTKWYIDG